jgi:hypothetical protein
MRFSWSVSCFFISVLFCFVFFNKWLITSCLFWRETYSIFIAKNTLVFTFIVQRVFSFSSTAFSFRFSPWFLFRSCYFFVSRCIYTTGLCWFSSQKRKSFMPIVVQMGACLDCGLDFCMSCLMLFR